MQEAGNGISNGGAPSARSYIGVVTIPALRSRRFPVRCLVRCSDLVPSGETMAERHRSGRLAVILHVDIAGSTNLVRRDERLAHERIQNTFRRFANTITEYQGRVRELRGDALLAEFGRASDAVTAALAFQVDHRARSSEITDDIRPLVRVGIAMGEVIVADNTVTGAGAVLAQRVEQMANEGGICITGAVHEALPQRLPFQQQDPGERRVKGFDEMVRVYRVALRAGESIPPPRARRFSENVTTGLCRASLLYWSSFYWPGPCTGFSSLPVAGVPALSRNRSSHCPTSRRSLCYRSPT